MNKIKLAMLSLLSFGYCFASIPHAISDLNELDKGKEGPAAIMVKSDPQKQVVQIYEVPTLTQQLVNKQATPEEQAELVNNCEVENNLIGEVTFTQSEDAFRTHWNRTGYSWNRWGGYSNNYSWRTPYSYPGYFTYGPRYYNYGWYYPYNNVHYGWYFR